MVSLQEINKLFAQSAALRVKAEKLGEQYVKENCPYKPGDKVKIKGKWGGVIHCVIQRVRFEKHSKIKGLADLHLQRFTSGWERAQKGRGFIFLDGNEVENFQIIEHVKK